MSRNKNRTNSIMAVSGVGKVCSGVCQHIFWFQSMNMSSFPKPQVNCNCKNAEAISKVIDHRPYKRRQAYLSSVTEADNLKA